MIWQWNWCQPVTHKEQLNKIPSDMSSTMWSNEETLNGVLLPVFSTGDTIDSPGLLLEWSVLSFVTWIIIKLIHCWISLCTVSAHVWRLMTRTECKWPVFIDVTVVAGGSDVWLFVLVITFTEVHRLEKCWAGFGRSGSSVLWDDTNWLHNLWFSNLLKYLSMLQLIVLLVELRCQESSSAR